jgi:hypothetical protein
LPEDNLSAGSAMNSVSLFSGFLSGGLSTSTGESLTDMLMARSSIAPQGIFDDFQATRQFGEFIDSLPASGLIEPSLVDTQAIGALIDGLPASDFVNSLPDSAADLGSLIDSLPDP